MAKSKLQKCQACGAEIAKGNKVTCPQCGKVNKKPFYQKPFFIIVVAFLIIGAISSMRGNDEKKAGESGNKIDPLPVVSEVKPEELKVKSEPEPIEPIVITVDELVEALEENALKASTTYKGEYVELTGKLSNIDSSGGYFSLGRLDNKLSLKTVLCKITKDHKDDVMNFSKEQEVTVLGTISNVGEIMGYTLKVEKIK